MSKNFSISEIIYYLVGAGVALLGFCGFLIRYIWKRHVEENDRSEQEFKTELHDLRKENEESHEKIHERINDIIKKKR